MKTLVIVESPTKAKTIGRFLGTDFKVESSYGHIRDLPKSKIGIDIEHNFEPQYVIPPKAKPVVDNLKKLAKRSSRVILATDEDREGEAIAWHLVTALDLGDSKKETERIVFHEITRDAILAALEHPRDIDLNLVDAQQARRVLDRLVGYELSPFLWRKIRYGLSAGRVQSVAVRLIVEREREIQSFRKDEYWSIEGTFRKDKQEFQAKLYAVDGKPLGKMGVPDESAARGILSELDGATYSVGEVAIKQLSRNPAPPFTTSTLQQEAARKLGFSAKQTMTVAQQLYENGYITYMRTDSLNLASSALAQAQEVIKEQFGDKYALNVPRYFTNKSKGAQEAHEAIRPTDISKKVGDSFELSDRGQKRLYDLIWKRTIASQMQSAALEQTSADIQSGDKRFVFRASGQVIIFDGFIRVYTEGRDEPGGEEEEMVLPKLATGDKVKSVEILPSQHFTEPPPRYTDATLIKALESYGVGRPSTYAPTLSTIQSRDYVEKIDKKYHPTEIGTIVNDMLVENFPEIVDINFTSHIEEELDEIADGKTKWTTVCSEFYKPFKKHLEEREASVEKRVEVSDVPCPHCGKLMLIKFGRMGKFLACPDPESKVTMPLPEEAAKIKELQEKTKGELCPICGKPMEIKRGRFGYFLGCTDYPKCKGVKKIWNKTGFKCPNCMTSPERKDNPGDIVEKRGRGRGKPFYACTRFPECNFVMNKKPETQAELDEAYVNWKANPPKTKKARIKTNLDKDSQRE
ncbi:MAG: type I DNA topoisomerase [Patescibacteria group bacterium]|nr:type I DNA topoisomerase [Patescibacteria group bacterium]MCL5224042.1 type I DNA topoisomerase [Patescibacteria group bacterium]